LGGLPPRLRWFIALVATAGFLAVVAVVLLDPGTWDRSVWPRLAALLVLTAASELGGLRLPHRGALEMLTLYEGMVVVNIALLPAGQAIAVSLAGLLAAQVLQCRAPVKAVFNLGMYATALAPAIGLYHLVAGEAGLLGARGLAAIAVGVAVFALVNLLLISQLLALLEDRPVWEVVQESSKMSTLIFLGNSAVGLIGVVCYLREPVVLPAVGLPVVTLWLAYRSAGREMQERDRFQHLYEVGQAFASSLVLEEVLPNVLPKVARLFGAEEAVGLAYNESLAGLDHDGKLVRLEDLLAETGPDNPRASCEVRARTSEGLERWLRCNHSLLYEGGEWTTDVVIVHDVTRIRQTERAKADFVATVSHELRTPITPIKGYVELLQARGARMTEEKRQDMLRIIAERAEHLARLVEDLLLASRISSERGGSAVPGLRRECTDLADAARRAATDWLRRPDSRLELELPDRPLEVDADPLRLVQVLDNLLSNAHKYSPADRPVRLRVWRDGGWAKAAVVDRGRGIPREELDRIFEKFHRVEDPMTMTTGGTGLGLYIARELTRAMGGEIEAASAPRRGSTFTVRLPLATAHEPPGPPPAAPPERERTDTDELGTPGPKRTRATDPLVRSS
jgi:signal transduction histidine kinase